MPIPPQTELKPFADTARYIVMICDGYEKYKCRFEHLVVWLMHYQDDNPASNLRYMEISKQEAEIVNTAKAFTYQLVMDIGREKFGEEHEPITPARLSQARFHAQKLKDITIDLNIKY